MRHCAWWALMLALAGGICGQSVADIAKKKKEPVKDSRTITDQDLKKYKQDAPGDEAAAPPDSAAAVPEGGRPVVEFLVPSEQAAIEAFPIHERRVLEGYARSAYPAEQLERVEALSSEPPPGGKTRVQPYRLFLSGKVIIDAWVTWAISPDPAGSQLRLACWGVTQARHYRDLRLEVPPGAGAAAAALQSLLEEKGVQRVRDVLQSDTVEKVVTSELKPQGSDFVLELTVAMLGGDDARLVCAGRLDYDAASGSFIPRFVRVQRSTYRRNGLPYHPESAG